MTSAQKEINEANTQGCGKTDMSADLLVFIMFVLSKLHH